jgi:hypothetical protein
MFEFAPWRSSRARHLTARPGLPCTARSRGDVLSRIGGAHGQCCADRTEPGVHCQTGFGQREPQVQVRHLSDAGGLEPGRLLRGRSGQRLIQRYCLRHWPVYGLGMQTRLVEPRGGQPRRQHPCGQRRAAGLPASPRDVNRLAAGGRIQPRITIRVCATGATDPMWLPLLAATRCAHQLLHPLPLPTLPTCYCLNSAQRSRLSRCCRVAQPTDPGRPSLARHARSGLVWDMGDQDGLPGS